LAVLAALCLLAPFLARGETMVQYFNTSWVEITARIPELAEAGYGSIWLPPPTKGSGGLSVGYDLWDPFDLGSRDQRGSVRTRYGTEAELLRLVETAHRFGIRVYFDNVMNHRAFDIPGYNEYTPVDIYPGMLPEDFHLRVTEDGFYRKWDNTRNWNDAWQVQYLGLADLIDIAQETHIRDGSGRVLNGNFGRTEGSTYPKISFVRHPNNPEFYLDTDLPLTVTNPANGFAFTVFTFANKEPYQDTGWTTNGYDYGGAGNGRFDWRDLNGNGQHDAGEPSEPFSDTGLWPNRPDSHTAVFGYGDGKYNMGNPTIEDVGAYLIRAALWELDHTGADGFRLDAVKHVPAYFFGAFGSDTSDAGYCGALQRQFNLTHGFADWNNHRDSCFDTEKSRDDAMLFGEHLGEPPAYGDYMSAGMRLVDNLLRGTLNDKLGNPWNGLNGFDQPGAGGFNPNVAVMHAQSHDNDYATRRELQHAIYFTRAQLGLIYTDGNHHSETLGESGGAFPRHANTAFLGQWGDARVPNLLYIHNHFARGYQTGRWSDGDVIAHERVDKRENGGMSDADGATLLFMLNDNYANGQGRAFRTGFPAGAYLWQYARGWASAGDSMNGFYITLGNDGGGNGTVDSGLIVPRGGYFAFSWKNPDLPEVRDMADSPVKSIQFVQDGQTVTDTVACVRKDGPDGDPAFNPYGLPDTNQADYAYRIRVPRVTAANLAFYARADGSAENILLKLDNGVDLNSQMGMGPSGGDRRDNKPGQSTDVFLGYEQMAYIQRVREKFAAANVSSNTVGSPGAETWQVTIGSPSSWSVNRGNGNWAAADQTASWVFHDPSDTQPPGGGPQFSTNAAGQTITVWTKIGYAGAWDRAWLYYTTNGITWPEGAGGAGGADTLVVPLHYDSHDPGDPTVDWVKGTLPAMAAGVVLRYKIGVAWGNSASIFPADATAVARKRQVETLFAVTNFNAATATVYPAGDNGDTATGLSEGLHVLRARSFLKRDGRASIYNTAVQTFYYDAGLPGGVIVYPGADGDGVGGQQYGVVVRTDPTVVEVWYHIDDADPSNDDVNTLVANGNGVGCEPFTDNNQNGAYDAGEPFTDRNGNGTWDANAGEAWMPALASAPSIAASNAYPLEWRFNYVNIPPGGSDAVLRVRLREISSATAPGFTNLTDAAGHFTTLTRYVHAYGPDQRLFVAWPARDGDTVDSNYVMKVHFSKSLADGLSEAELLSAFTIRIQSAESGRTDGGVVQDRSAYGIDWGGWDGYYALTYRLPNLYNGQPDWLHGIEVTLARAGHPTLRATRLVRARPVEAAPYIVIVQPPEYDSDGKPYTIVIADVPNPTPEQRSTPIQVATLTNGSDVRIAFDFAPSAFAGGIAYQTNHVSGSTRLWDFQWTNLVAGDYRFTATVATPSGESNSATRNAHVVLQQRTTVTNATDTDYDDDGLLNDDETTATPLPDAWLNSPKPNPETWNNGDVHIHYAYGHSDPLSCDTDNDGLPDGLEVGWRQPINADTDTNADTNADGWKNFMPDLDPPLFNTLDNYGSVPGVNSASEGGDRARLVKGAMTDPANPDSDGDGLLDGIEDANHNGWVDGDGSPLLPGQAASSRGAWPTGRWTPAWRETDPNNPDTDGDGLSDGYGEDKDLDGRIAGDTNTNRVWDAGELWTETDPLNPDTDGDGLPDGWEVRHGLNPFDDGAIGHTNMSTGAAITNVENGASGDPDGDGFSNLQELANGTNPRVADVGAPLPPGSIVVGPRTNVIVVGAVSNAQEFTDWTANDLVALDAYDGDGQNNQGGDVYHAHDGYDSSRDIVAFYIHDGGDVAAGGDGKFHFRVDLQDLKPYAEAGSLDLYVVIDTASPGVGEYALPDQIDTATEMRWEAVVAVYDGSFGVVYVDTDPVHNTTAINEDLAAKGVQARGAGTPHGFGQAYFNSDLDAVEFSISREALKDAGWLGLDAADLNFQVYTTKDGTQNSPTGPGDIGGRSDIRDSLMDSWIASDYWRDQTYISQNSVLKSWCGWHAHNQRGHAAKVAMTIHGNQHILPGNQAQNLINTGAGTGYHRPLDAHEAFGAPLNLHVTPTLASAMQWARVDPAAGTPWRDGPAFNARLRRLAGANVVAFLGSTFSDHMLPYFTTAFNNDNAALAREFLAERYGVTSTPYTVFWPPERLLDADVLDKIGAMGYGYTLLDQNAHLFQWFGRSFALGDGGYRINRINGRNCFIINDDASAYRFQNQDNGLNLPLRCLFSRKARSDTQDQVVTLFGNWEDFTSAANCAAYDRNIRWMASHPWITLVRLEDIAAGRVDIDGDGNGDNWWVEDHGTGLPLAKVSDDWMNHATEGNYDAWYVGSAQEESLQNKHFEIRPGVPVPSAYGMLYFDGIVSQAWARVSAIADPNLARLARMALHASVFETAFHNEDNNDLSKFSTGDFVYPDTSYDSLADMALQTQSQTRHAATLRRVDAWLSVSAVFTNTETGAEDVDLDGEDEYLLFNDRLFAVFERLGGRLAGVWIKDRLGGRTCQALGNPVAFSGSATEREGDYNVTNGGGVVAYRTSGLKDWWAVPAGGSGTLQYVNDLYTVAGVGGGWRLTSSDGRIRKTVTLAPRSGSLEAQYELLGSLNPGTLYVRNGFTPDLADLLVNGQNTLADPAVTGGRCMVANTNFHTTVRAGVGYADAGHSAVLNAGAVDDDPGKGVTFHTVNMRNQAQTQQIEVYGTNAFAFALQFEVVPSDWDQDGMPDDYEMAKGFDPGDPLDAGDDADDDGVSNGDEYVAGTDPWNAYDYFAIRGMTPHDSGFTVRFPAVPLRAYDISYADRLVGVAWSNATPVSLTVPAPRIYEWLDDGSFTAPSPADSRVTNRFYRIEVRLNP
jgi:glycosidase